MDDKKKILFLVLVLSTFLGSLGQFLFKLGLESSLIYLGVGLVAYGLSTIIYLYILGRMHLSWTYGVGGLGYIFASLLAFFLLGEQVSPLRWVGIMVIALGTALVGLS
jgi:drug/metabolite transporter (DMT)-like permease